MSRAWTEPPHSHRPRGGPCRRSLLAAAAALSLSLALPATGQGAVKFGIQAERQTSQTLSQPEVERMRRGGARVVRTPFSWELVQRSPDASLDFSNFDRLMTWASEGRLRQIEVLPILTGSPGWVKGAQSNNEPPTTRSDLEKWRRFVTATVGRYGKNGSFWKSNKGLKKNPIRGAQVWNEPNLKTFWTNGKPNPKEYARLLDLTDKAIRAAKAKVKTILAGMPERADAPLPMRDYLKKLYKVKGVNKNFDVVAIHPFAQNEKGVEGGVDRIRKIVDDNGDKGKPLWLTEVGFASAGPNSPFTKSKKGQAKALLDTFRLIKKKANKYEVERAYWYSWRDSDTDPPQNSANDRWQTYTGLFTRQGDPKPSWTAFARFAGGKAGRQRLP